MMKCPCVLALGSATGVRRCPCFGKESILRVARRIEKPVVVTKTRVIVALFSPVTWLRSTLLCQSSSFLDFGGECCDKRASQRRPGFTVCMGGWNAEATAALCDSLGARLLTYFSASVRIVAESSCVGPRVA